MDDSGFQLSASMAGWDRFNSMGAEPVLSVHFARFIKWRSFPSSVTYGRQSTGRGRSNAPAAAISQRNHPG